MTAPPLDDASKCGARPGVGQAASVAGADRHCRKGHESVTLNKATHKPPMRSFARACLHHHFIAHPTDLDPDCLPLHPVPGFHARGLRHAATARQPADAAPGVVQQEGSQAGVRDAYIAGEVDPPHPGERRAGAGARGAPHGGLPRQVAQDNPCKMGQVRGKGTAGPKMVRVLGPWPVQGNCLGLLVSLTARSG